MNTKRGSVSMLPVELLAGLADVLKVLGHPQRLRIVEHLDLNGDSSVTCIAGAVNLPQAAVSHHLGVMRRVGLLRAERRGKEMRYDIANPSAVTILDCIRKKVSHK